MDVFGAYKGKFDWLKERTIFLTKSGSHAYGTNIEGSDIDVKGVCIPPVEYFLGFHKSFEQEDRGFDGLDCGIYGIRKFFQLATQNNPNIIELLFTDEDDWLYVNPNVWGKIYDERQWFLSRDIKARFCGYASSQLARIHTHRGWLLNPPKVKPNREEFGLPNFKPISHDQLQAAESQIKKQMEAWDIDWDVVDEAQRIDIKGHFASTFAEIQLYSDNAWSAAGRKLGYDDNFLEHLKAERAYRQASANWKQYQDWETNRNPKRHELEKKYGYDTKHAGHLIRLLRQCREILAGEGVKVKRPDAEELKAIRNGLWSFDTLMAEKDKMVANVETAFLTTTLPKKPDYERLDDLFMGAVRSMI